MALTRITKGVIKPNENYDTHDINSTGIITATGLNVSGNASIGGVLTYEDVTNIDSIGIITARSDVKVGTAVTLTSAGAGFYAGIVTASDFVKRDGTSLGGGAVGGASSITMNDNVPINFGTDALWRQYRQGDILYLQPVNGGGTAKLWISANNQVWLRSGSGGTFLDCNGTRNAELYSTTFNHKTDVQIPDKIIHADDTNTAIRFPENDTFTVETAGTERLRINNTGITTLSGITTVTGNTLFTDQLGVAGVSTFIGEIHGDGQRLGSLTNSKRFSGLFLTNGYSYYGSNKLFVADSNGFGLDAYGSNDSWLKANSGGGSAGDCWMRTGGSGGYIIAKGAGAVELHHAGTSDKKLETVSGGVNVVGSLTVNGAALQSGIAGIDTTGTSHFNHLSVTGIATFSGTEAIFNRVSFPQNPGNKTIVGNMAGGSGPQGSEITCVGYGAGYASSGNRLTAIGRMSGKAVSGTDNTCIGYEAGYSNLGAQKNVFVGKDAGMGNKTGSNNIVVGSDAGEGVWNNANYSNSVILGAEAGATLTSNNSNVIVIGYDVEPSSNSVTNEITLGNSSINHLRIPGIGVEFSTSGNQISGITTFSSNIHLGDTSSGSLYIGSGNDFRLYHNGQNSVLAHLAGTPNNGGGLFIDSNSYITMRINSNVKAIECVQYDAVKLYHNGSQKFTTKSGGVEVTGSVTDSKGDLRDIPQNSQSSTYTLVASDAGKHIKAVNNITIPSGVFSIGEAVTIINSQSNDITIIQGSSTTVYNTADGSTGNVTLAGRGMATFICTDSNYFYISGSGMT